MKLTLSDSHRVTCAAALSFAAGIWSNDYSAISRVQFASGFSRLKIGCENFGERVRDAAMEFSDSRNHFTTSDAQIVAGAKTTEVLSSPSASTIDLDRSQSEALREALEMLARVHTGQMHILIDGRAKQSSDWGHILYDLWLHRCAASFGIHHPEISDEARVAWDLHRVIRGHLAWARRPGGGLTGEFDRPITQTSRETTLATVS